MNKITFPRKDFEGNWWSQKDIEKWFCNSVLTKLSKKLSSIKTTNIIEKKTLRIITNHLYLVLIAPPQRLELWTEIFDKYRANISDTFIKNIRKAFNYDNFRKNILVDLAKILNVKSCPYCNMHYTLYAEEITKKSIKVERLAKFQYDHFFDKCKYPMLSMSLYNLIPSCSTCNHGKSTTKLTLSFNPYYSDISKQFKFELNNPINLYIGAKANDLIDVNFIATDSNKQSDLDDFINTFHLKALYQRHGDIAQEAFDKVYQSPYYSNPDNFRWLSNTNPDYIKRLWLGTYTNENEIEKRPMTKFIQDLNEQAQMLKLSEKD